MSDKNDPRLQGGKTTITFERDDGPTGQTDQDGSHWRTEEALRHEVTSRGGKVIAVEREDPPKS